jgi:urease accessory protein
MQLAEPPLTHTWRAQLALEYQRRGGRTVLASRRHDGPLVVQKALYPEGDAVCHGIIVHPPAGIVGGDSLEMDIRVGAQGHALLTTPGAGKWYRSAGNWAQQHNALTVDEGACLEWLPQETIVFDGALASLNTEVRLGAGARYIGWEILCLGRAGSGERFERGQYVSRVFVWRAGKPLWMERGGIAAGGTLMRSAAGLSGKTVCGTLIAVADNVDRLDIVACRGVTATSGATAVTRLPQVVVVRYLGDSSEAARHYFADVWGLLRPLIAGQAAVAPRIWST